MANLVMECPRCWGKVKDCAKCHGSGKVPDRQLSPHFLLSEMLASNTAKFKGLANDPTPEVEANLEKLCRNALEDIRAKVGPLKVNSGYRSEAVNAATGGSKTSAHCYGLAADLHPPNGCKALMDAIIHAGVKLDQLIFEHTWVHVGLLQPATGKQRGDRLTMNVVNGQTTYTPYA